MSAETPIEPGPSEWLIKKGEYFYRPNKSGYTTEKAQAGRYAERDAWLEAEIEPWHMNAIHQDDVPDAVGDVNVDELKTLRSALSASQEEITRLRKALEQRPVIFMDEKGNVTTTDGQAVLAMFEAIGPARVGSKLLPLVPLPTHPHEGDST